MSEAAKDAATLFSSKLLPNKCSSWDDIPGLGTPAKHPTQSDDSKESI